MCITFLFTDHHHIAARLNSLPKDHSLHRDQRPGTAHWAPCPSVGDHWVSPTPLLCLWQTSCPCNTRGDCYADVASPKAAHSSFAFPELHMQILRCRTPHSTVPGWLQSVLPCPLRQCAQILPHKHSPQNPPRSSLTLLTVYYTFSPSIRVYLKGVWFQYLWFRRCFMAVEGKRKSPN